jgi:hypothetical protein
MGVKSKGGDRRMDTSAENFNSGSDLDGISGGTANIGFDAILHSTPSPTESPNIGSGYRRRPVSLVDIEAAYKDLNEQLAKVGRKEIERRISFGRTAARNRAILKCVSEYVGSSPSELQERLIEILTVDFMDTPITDMEIIQALR